MKNKLILFLYILKYLGISWLLYRIWYYIKIKSGIVRLFHPSGTWEDYPFGKILSQKRISNPADYKNYRLHNSPQFFFNPTYKKSYRTILSEWNDSSLIESVDKIKDGYFRYFSHLTIRTKYPPDWLGNSFWNVCFPSNRHWTTIGDFDGGDVKIVWELNRFTFVFDLFRAYWRTNDEKYPELFWELIEDWYENNPPNYGPNWKCGQETTFRVMAWCWGLYGFLDSPHSTSERVAKLTKMIFFSGVRIESNIGYASSQKNNHSISEAVGLWTIGVLFPEFKYANRWKAKGKNLIEKLTLELINNEGAFTQNSVNYHRLLLHDLIWVLRLGDLNGESFSDSVKNRFRKAAEFLYQLQDDKSGKMPNYGANDGALILPLSNCDFTDYRPVLQSSYYYLDKKRIYDNGPWDEDLVWLFGPDSLNAPIVRKEKYNLELKETGYYTFRTPNGFLFTRCGKHIFRPGQGDILHVGIWWNAHNIAVDPGTYSYNAPPPWEKGLGQTLYHNTVTVDDLNQMDSYGKFLAFPWVTGKVIRNEKYIKDEYRYFEGTHNGYHRLKDPVQYRRGIVNLYEDYWIIIDKLSAKEVHKYRLHWLFSNFPNQFDENQKRLILYPDGTEYHIRYGSMNENSKTSLISADEYSPRGWWSPYYYYKEPALSLDMIVNDSSTIFYTVLGPYKIDVKLYKNTLKLNTKDHDLAIALNPNLNEEPMVLNVSKVEIIRQCS